MTRRTKVLLKRPDLFATYANGLDLRPYQLPVINAITDSVQHGRGMSFVVIFPRQSGKNETQALLFAFLMTRYMQRGGEIIAVSPTYKPQTINAMYRLQVRLSTNIYLRNKWRKESGYTFRANNARVIFYSADKKAKVVGATASLLLSVDEAQDVDPAKYDKDFSPMAANTNATRVFWGTRWTSDTLLERELSTARLLEAHDGRQRVFFVTADEVRKVRPEYGAFVDEQIARMGRDHPLIKTQYFCETIDAEAGMFPPARLALIQPDRAPHTQPEPGQPYAFLIDVAGTDESKRAGLEGLTNPGRDSTTLSVASIDLTSVPTLTAPTYRIEARRAWQGNDPVTIAGQIIALAGTWKPLYIVIDATGVGDGLAAILARHFPSKLIPIHFTAQSKSEIGYKFLAIIDTGRFRNLATDSSIDLQYTSCRQEILPGAAHTMRWGVPEGLRDPRTAETIHDDHLLADALVAVLDALQWHVQTNTVNLPAIQDPINRKVVL